MGDLRRVWTQMAAQMFVLDLRPSGAPFAHLRGRAPSRRLASKSTGSDLARGDQDMGVKVALIALLPRQMHRHVGDHPVGRHMPIDEVPDQRASLLEVEFVRQG